MTTVSNPISSTDARYLVAFRRDGLGGRLQNLLWSWRFGRSLGVRTIVFWDAPPEGMVQFYGSDYRVSLIFDVGNLYFGDPELGLIFVDGPPGDLSHVRFIDDQDDWNKTARLGWSADQIFANSNFVGYRSYRSIRVFDEPLDADMFSAQARDLFASLPLNHVVAQRIELIEQELDLSTSIGVHYRRGDIVHNLMAEGRKTLKEGRVSRRFLQQANFYFRKCAPFSAYCRIIESLSTSGRKIILFSDDADAYARFTGRFSVESIGQVSVYTNDLVPIQADFVEMLSLARCEHIVSTNSGFQQTAQLIGAASYRNVNSTSSVAEYLEEFGELIGAREMEYDNKVVGEIARLLIDSPTFAKLVSTLGGMPTLAEVGELIAGKVVAN